MSVGQAASGRGAEPVGRRAVGVDGMLLSIFQRQEHTKQACCRGAGAQRVRVSAFSFRWLRKQFYSLDRNREDR